VQKVAVGAGRGRYDNVLDIPAYARQGGENNLDIPAFLRKQAD